MHYETFAKKHDIKREVQRQENWQKTHGVGENKKNPATSLISSDKKDRKMLNSIHLGIKKHSSLSTSKSNNKRSILKINNLTSLISCYHEEIGIQSLDTHIISEQTMSEKQFGQKRQSMEK